MKCRKPSKLGENASAASLEASSVADAGRVAPSATRSATASSRRAIGWAAIIVAATAAAFGNSFTGSFLFDDETSITLNPSIRQLWPIWPALCPPSRGETVSGRPLLNVSLAVNYAISGYHVWSYHAANLAIHIFGALLLFGILRRTFLLPTMRDRWGAAAAALALAVALLWAIHPLQTESVTYIVQRAESLVGFWYLLTLYCFLRGVGSARAIYWYVGSVLACLLGMASKEVMVSAPLMVLLYDRTFCAGSFLAAWQRRYGLYLGLAGTWLLLAGLVISTHGRGGSAGFGTAIGSWEYLCTQFGAIVLYLQLSVWPHPLVLDYGVGTAHGAAEIVPYAIVVGWLGVATVVALCRWPKVGFLGAWFFAILAPTSSVVPVATQTIAEHRMYLSLAAIVAGVVLGGWFAGQWLVRRGTIRPQAMRVAGGILATALAIALGVLTFQRNADYRSKIAIWTDTVAKAPENSRAYDCLALALADCGRVNEAIANYQKALELNPDFAQAHSNLGIALANRGRGDEAVAHYQRALELDPNFPQAHNNLGDSLANRGQIDEAIAEYRKALKNKPDYETAYNNLGIALVKRGQLDEAIDHFRKAAEINPDMVEAHVNLGLALVDRGRFDEAIAQFGKALEIKPDNASILNDLGIAFGRKGQWDEAIAQHRKAVELSPKTAELHVVLANALVKRGRSDEAIAEYQKTLEIKPGHAKARYELAGQLDLHGMTREAIGQWEELIRLQPKYVAGLNSLAWTLATHREASVRNGARAVELAQRAEQLAGGNAAVLNTLAAAYAEAGRFPEAVQTARKAMELAQRKNNQSLAESIKAKIRLYEAGSPFRESQPPVAGSGSP